MDKGIIYIIAGVVAVLVIVVGVEVGIESTMTTGIDLNLHTSVASDQNAR
jgi:hypothetical protein